jgi:hypothetical protein
MSTGKRNPLDPEPSEEGDVLVLSTETERGELEVGVRLRDDTLDRARLLDVKLHRSHFATCPERRDRPATPRRAPA